MARLQRRGQINIANNYLIIREDPGCVDSEYQRLFKRDVFRRVVQQLTRLGWCCVVPEGYIIQYGRLFAADFRYCVWGALKADLRVCGRVIELRFFQSVNCPDRPDNEGRYQPDIVRHMPYLVRLKMIRTRRILTQYLLNVFDGYEQGKMEEGVDPWNGMSAAEWVQQEVRLSWHYDPEIGRRRGEVDPWNCKSAEGGVVRHGAKVWYRDNRGRWNVGIAHYHINNMWWVISGRYGLRNLGSFELFVQQPPDLRSKRHPQGRPKLLAAMTRAVAVFDFERAARVRDAALARGYGLESS